MIRRPEASDHAPFFQGYVDLAVAFAAADGSSDDGGDDEGDVLNALAEQGANMQQLLEDTDDAVGDHRYAAGKWSVKQLVQHVADGERMFCYRAMCIARGDTQELPEFDEQAYAEHDGSAARTLVSIADEYATVRAATLSLFDGFDELAWRRRGRANGQDLAVVALPWIVLGHDLHHFAVLRDRYDLGRPTD